MAWNVVRKRSRAAPASDGDASAARSLAPAEAQGFCHTFESLDIGGFWQSDAQGLITYVSPGAAARLVPDGQVVGQRITELFISDEGSNETARNLRFALSRRSRFTKLTLRSHGSEGPRWWLVSGEAQFAGPDKFTGFRGICTEITDEHRLAQENSRLAMHDALTGLLNRRQMSAVIERTLSSFQSQGRPCATLLIDLDRFKQVNDTLGHSAGDMLLKQVAERLVSVVGSGEKVCRLGGDEFQVLLPDVDDRGDLGELAGRIITMLSQPYAIEGKRCTIGASVGIAISPFDGRAPDELMRNADLALYAAKRSGRSRYRFFSNELLDAAEERRLLEEDLHDALAAGEIELHYQPVVRAETSIVVGAEALLRWNHPKRGYISPTLFIPIAEESPRLIAEIGAWALRTACNDAANWPHSLRIAVNVSPAQFADPSFPGLVAHALATSQLRPDRLELEITEGVFLADSPDTDATFQALKDLGVRLALDDFGTGYSSLGYLKTAPFDKIKIDQSFVRGAAQQGSRNKAIITAIVALAKALDMETTAEGIETFDQLDMLRELGVSHIQGFIYSQPMTNAEYLAGASQTDWGLKPQGHAKQRHERMTVLRRIGAIHENHYYPLMLRNLSATGALIEGVSEVPLGTRFVLHFGEGQIEVATVRRQIGEHLGVEFDRTLVNDGAGGLCTRTRISTYDLVNAGLPADFETASQHAPISPRNDSFAVPAFTSTLTRKAIPGTART